MQRSPVPVSWRIVYTLASGEVKVVAPSPEYVATFETDALAIEAMRQPGSVPPGALNTTVLDFAALPGRRFRAAWRFVGGAVVVDLPLARALRSAEIRVEKVRQQEVAATKARQDLVIVPDLRRMSENELAAFELA